MSPVAVLSGPITEFSFFPNTAWELEVILTRVTSIVERVVGEEPNLQDIIYRQLYSNDRKRASPLIAGSADELSNIILQDAMYNSGWPGLHHDFLSRSIYYLGAILGPAERKVKLEGIPIYTVSHSLSVTRMMAVLDASVESIYASLFHDCVEEVVDRILQRVDDIVALLGTENTIFRENYVHNTPHLPHSHNKDRRDIADDILDSLYEKAAECIFTGVFKIAEEEGVPKNLVYKMRSLVEQLTKKRHESYDSYLQGMGHDALLIKAADQAHNSNTQGGVELNGSEGRSLSFDQRVKALYKRLLFVTAVKQRVLSSLYPADEILKQLYPWHLAVAHFAYEDCNQIARALDARYGALMLPEDLRGNYECALDYFSGDHQPSQPCFRDYFALLDSVLKEYAKRGLLERITSASDPDENAFLRDTGFSFGGTVLKVALYAAGRNGKELYERQDGRLTNRAIAECGRDFAALLAVFGRYLMLTQESGFDPQLQVYFLKNLFTM